MTKWQLFSALGGKAFPNRGNLIDCNDSSGTPRLGFVHNVQREDGSGSSFNLTISQHPCWFLSHIPCFGATVMTKRELIDHLSNIPDDAEVTIGFHEDDEFTKHSIAQVHSNPDDPIIEIIVPV